MATFWQRWWNRLFRRNRRPAVPSPRSTIAAKASPRAYAPTSPLRPQAPAPTLPDPPATSETVSLTSSTPASPVAPNLGEQLGNSGGQGSVFKVPDRPGFVFKRYVTPIPDASVAFISLMGAADEIGDSLPGGVDLFWPKEIHERAGCVEGYFMREVPQDYYLEYTTPTGVSPRLGQLMHALPGNGHFHLTDVPNPQDRVELLSRVAIGLDALHAHSVVFPDISFANFIFTQPSLRVGFLDLDSARPLATAQIELKDNVGTSDWHDPHAQDGAPLGFDLDRYKFAVLAYRLLGVKHRTAPLDADRLGKGRRFPDLTPESESNLKWLLRRALGPRGSRPPLCEWVHFLRSCEAD